MIKELSDNKRARKIFFVAISIIAFFVLLFYLLENSGLKRQWISSNKETLEADFQNALEKRDASRARSDLAQLEILQPRPELRMSLRRLEKFGWYDNEHAENSAWSLLRNSKILSLEEVESLRHDLTLSGASGTLVEYCKSPWSGDSTCSIACASVMLQKAGSARKVATAVAEAMLNPAPMRDDWCPSAFQTGMAWIDIAARLDPHNHSIQERDEMLKLLSLIEAPLKAKRSSWLASDDQAAAITEMRTTTQAENLGRALNMNERADNLGIEGNRQLSEALQHGEQISRHDREQAFAKSKLLAFSAIHLSEWKNDPRWISWSRMSRQGVHPRFALWAANELQSSPEYIGGYQLPFSRGIVACGHENNSINYACAFVNWAGEIQRM